MNEARRLAFEEWWRNNEAQRFTPNEIWDAACDWMKDEILWRMEQCVEKSRDE